MDFRTPYTYFLGPDDMEINEEPSMTIPDQSLSIREIFERSQRGLPLSLHTYEDGYDENADLDVFDELLDSPDRDLTDYTLAEKEALESKETPVSDDSNESSTKKENDTETKLE